MISLTLDSQFDNDVFNFTFKITFQVLADRRKGETCRTSKLKPGTKKARLDSFIKQCKLPNADEIERIYQKITHLSFRYHVSTI